MKKRRIGIALTLLGIMGLAVPAQAAEGTFTSFLTGVVTDFRSRNWSDKNLTADATTIRMENCVIQSGLIDQCFSDDGCATASRQESAAGSRCRNSVLPLRAPVWKYLDAIVGQANGRQLFLQNNMDPQQ